MTDIPGRRPLTFDARLAGLAVCVAFLAVVVVLTLIDPDRRSVVPVYRGASALFFAGETLYPDGPAIMGYLYLPGFAVLFAPFERIGPHLGDAAWKAIGLLLLAYAAWSQCRDLDRRAATWLVPAALVMALPIAASSAVNGQSNIVLGALCWLMVLAAYRDEGARLALFAGLAVLVKPIAIVALLLVAGTRPRACPWLVAGLGAALALPYGFADPAYVTGLYAAAGDMFLRMSLADRFPSADFSAIFRTLGAPLPDAAETVVRLVAAVATWGLALAAALRLPREGAALTVWLLAAAYMCLFNPRAEGLTYVLVAVPLGLVVAAGLFDRRDRVPWSAVAALLVFSGLNSVFDPILALTRDWLKPVATMIMLAAAFMLATRPRGAVLARWFGDRPA